MNRRHITRTTCSDGSTIAELYVATSEHCPHCAGAGLWANPAGDYHVCTHCGRGCARAGAPHSATTNPALAQIVAQLARARE